MSSTLILNANTVWMPSGTVYCTFLENTAKELDAQDAILATYLRSHLEHYYINLMELDADKFQILQKAADVAYETSLPLAFGDNTPPMGRKTIALWTKLKAFMRVDPRIPQNHDKFTFQINKSHEIKARGWVLDYCLEYLALLVNDTDLSDMLLKMRPHQNQEASVKNLSQEQFCDLLEAVEKFKNTCESDKVREEVNHFPVEHNLEILPFAINLHSAFTQDDRMQNCPSDLDFAQIKRRMGLSLQCSS